MIRAAASRPSTRSSSHNAAERSTNRSRRLQERRFFFQQEKVPMRLFMFKSEGNRGLRAFAGDSGGRQLPSRHGPWTAVGVVREDKEPPHKMSRAVIEQSI